jgi:predicted RNA-binding Zn-ribbon protein involved in translation (DUF1610 family)
MGMRRNRERADGSVHTYNMIQRCSYCNTAMVYVYGEIFKCPICGRKELSDFGKVREFLEENGAQSVIVIHEATNVDIEVIEEFLKDGRVQISNNSDSYIRCQSCGKEIKYGRYCPECATRAVDKVKSGMLSMQAKGKTEADSVHSPDMRGEMHVKHKTLSGR